MRIYLFILLLPFISFGQQECDTIFPPNAIEVIYCITNPSCHNICDGSISIQVNGNNQPYSYSWTIGGVASPFTAGDNSRDSLCGLPYIISIIDGNGDLVDNSYINTLLAPPNFTFFEDLVLDPSCFNYNDGIINLTIGGATAPYDFLWDDGVSSEDRLGLDSGIYILTTTDFNNCFRVDVLELEYPEKVNSTTVPSILSCIGLCDGEGIVIPSGGIEPYSYLWDNGESNDTVNNLCFGLNTVLITDSSGCLDTNFVLIENPIAIELSNITIDEPCFETCDGQLSVTIDGGTSPYLSSWNFGGIEFSTDTITDNNLCSGDYQLIYSDANNCIDSLDFILLERDAFDVDFLVINDSCYNSCTGQISVEVLNKNNPPYTYGWNNGQSDTIISSLCSDSFNLIITDERSCKDTFEFFIAEGDSMYFDSLVIVDNICFGLEEGAISLINFNGGINPITYTWSNSQTTLAPGINNLASGFYTFIVEDAFGCSLPSTNVLVEGPDSLFATPSLENVSCFGASDGLIDIDIFGGIEPYFISWNTLIPDSISTDTVPAGQYTYTIVDSNECAISSTLIIEEPTQLSIADSIVNILCKDSASGEIHLTVSGGTQPYSFSIDAVTYQSQNYFVNLLAGAYTITVKDTNGCLLSSQLYNISQPLTSITSSLSATDLLCFESTGDITLNVSGGTPNYSFLWNSGEITQDLNGITAGNYTVNISDNNACEVIETITVSDPSEIQLTESVNNLLCFEDNKGSIDITVIGGTLQYSFLWSNGETTEDISNLSSGTYTLLILDANECEHEDLFTVNQPDILEISYTEADLACFVNLSGSIDVTISGGTPQYSFDWSNGSSLEDISSLSAGSYDLIVTDMNDCEENKSILINEPSEMIFEVSQINLVCNNVPEGEISVSVIGGSPSYSYSIDGGNNYQGSSDFENLEANNYSISIEDDNGCIVSGLVQLTEPNPLTILEDNVVDVTNCYGDASGSIMVVINEGTSPYTYLWKFNNNSYNFSTSSIFELMSGSYDLTVTDINNCSMIESYYVSQPDRLELTATISLPCTEPFGDITLFVAGGTDPYTYQWSFESDSIQDATSPTINNIPVGTYIVEVEDANGCDTVAYFDVIFDVDCIFIPSGFTPNGDGVHDKWEIKAFENISDVVVKIYNRWGQEVFSSSGYYRKWDGTSKGVNLPTAAYYYVIEANDKLFKGTVTIKR